jgi:hypothetical protein
LPEPTVEESVMKPIGLDSYQWQRHCRGLYQTPIARILSIRQEQAPPAALVPQVHSDRQRSSRGAFWRPFRTLLNSVTRLHRRSPSLHFECASWELNASRSATGLLIPSPLLIQHCCTRTQTRSAVGVWSSFWLFTYSDHTRYALPDGRLS